MERLSEDQELRDDFRLLGGVPLILSLLRYTHTHTHTHTHAHTIHTRTHTHTPYTRTHTIHNEAAVRAAAMEEERSLWL